MSYTDDPQVITEADIDTRPVGWDGEPITEDELMTAEEWWDNYFANYCCERSNWYCPCGGAPSEPESRLLRRDDLF